MVVTRDVQYRRVAGELGTRRRPLGFDEELTFVDPLSGNQVTWVGHHRLASYLGRFDGKYIVIGRQAICSYEDVGQPRWKAYEFTPAGWTQIDLPRQTNPLVPNLVLEAYKYDMAKKWSLLSISDKKTLDAGARVYLMERTIDPNDPSHCL